MDLEVGLRSERAAADGDGLFERFVVAADLEHDPDHRVQVARDIEIPALGNRLVVTFFDREGHELVSTRDLGSWRGLR